MNDCSCVAKHRLEAAGYTVYKPSCFPERTIKRVVTRTGRDNPWLVNSHEEMSQLADMLLGPCGCNVGPEGGAVTTSGGNGDGR